MLGTVPLLIVIMIAAGTAVTGGAERILIWCEWQLNLEAQRSQLAPVRTFWKTAKNGNDAAARQRRILN